VEAGAEERGVPRHGGGRGEASLHHQERSQAPRSQCRRNFLRFRFRLFLKSYGSGSGSGSPTFAKLRFRIETIKSSFKKNWIKSIFLHSF
jgi:hypothetical protein